MLDQNPFGFAFRHVETSKPISKLDVMEQAGIFMKRHFGTGGCVAKTPSFCRFLLEMGQELPLETELKQEMQRLEAHSSEASVEWQPPKQLADTRRGQLLLDEQLYGSFADEEEAEGEESAETEELERQPSSERATEQSMTEQMDQLLTDPETECGDRGNELVSQLIAMEQPQRATIIEWPEGKMQIINCAWHLKYCSWRNEYDGEYHLPKWYALIVLLLPGIPCKIVSSPCRSYCHKIKLTMEYIYELSKLLLATEDEQMQLQLTCSSDLNGNIMSLNGMVNHLNHLIQLQLHEQEQPQDDDAPTPPSYMQT